MKMRIDGIIVVEGNNDVSFLSSFIDSYFVSLNGLELNNTRFLKQASKNTKIYLLTDSDKEGVNIRRKINQIIDNCINIEVDINKCNKHGKHGVFECEIGELQHLFSKFQTDNCISENTHIADYVRLKMLDFYDKKRVRKILCEKLDIEYCNNKTFLSRIDFLDLTKEEIDNALREII